jgi:hypothetical protein
MPPSACSEPEFPLPPEVPPHRGNGRGMGLCRETSGYCLPLHDGMTVVSKKSRFPVPFALLSPSGCCPGLIFPLYLYFEESSVIVSLAFATI